MQLYSQLCSTITSHYHDFCSSLGMTVEPCQENFQAISSHDKSTTHFPSFLPLCSVHARPAQPSNPSIAIDLTAVDPLQRSGLDTMFGMLRVPTPEQDRVALSSAPLPPPNTLTPMPTSDFENREALLIATKEWAAGQGFAVVIQRSRFNRIWLKCDRGGSYENRRNITPDQRKRKRGESRLLGCPFKMVASVRKDGTWHVVTENPGHNHDPSGDLSAHPTLRRMTDEQQQKVADMCDNGNTPQETIEELRRMWPDIKILTRDVYNARKKHKTVQELKAAQAGQPLQPPVQDPNGIIPGPNERGRWAWVPDGEEVTSKKGKRRRRTAPASHTPLDPQLSTPDRPPPNEHSLSAGNQQFINQLQNAISPTSPNPHGPAQAPGTAWMSQLQDNSANQEDLTSRLRSQVQTRSTNDDAIAALRSSIQKSNSTNAEGEGAQDAQVLMSRIDRMEKEQQDQKNMLSAILGAVKGINGTPS